MCSIVQIGVRSPHVIEVYPALQSMPDFAASLEGMQIDTLVFQGAPEPLDHDIVQPAPLAIHGNLDVGVFEHLGERIW